MAVATNTGLQPQAGAATRPRRRIFGSTRGRILGWYIVLLAVALVAGLLLQRSILLAQLDDEVDSQLIQEVEELEQLAAGRDPNTGEPFGRDVAAIFSTFLSRNVPVEGEAMFTIVGGQPFASTLAPVQLLDEPDVFAAWAATTTPTRGELETSAGEVRYIAAPLLNDGEVAGVFVVAMFMDERYSDVTRVVRDGAIVYGSAFLVASMLAWIAAGRVLRPVRLLTNAARSISDENWQARIPVRGDDEIVELTRTFNDMLDRLELAFSTQRQFIDDAGHELRTPITIIQGHLELLGDDPAEREETRALVLDELGRMERMVEDLLLLAKSEAPDFLLPEAVDLGVLTAEWAAKANALGQRAWQVDEAARVLITADRQRLTQAVMNLARNALEHTPPTAPVALGSRVEGNEVRIWVRDGGPGIAEGDRERIFRRFARGGSGKRTSQGAGLGLAIVTAIAQAHGGRVELRTEAGKGAMFTLVLPIEEDM